MNYCLSAHNRCRAKKRDQGHTPTIAGRHSAAGKPPAASDDCRKFPNRLGRALRALVVAVAALACLGGSAPLLAATFDENNLLLLDVTLDRQRLASSVTAYAFGDSALVSLAELGASL